MIGRRIGRFQIVSKLGEGGMGSVWRAEDPLLDRAVAIKILPDDLQRSPEAWRQLLREARASSRLDHPGIATLYDVGQHEGRYFIAIACIDGRTVSDRIAEGPVPLREAVRLVADAADALEYAHVHGVIHRDITARNIMIARDGRVVVIDFGLARAVDATPSRSSGKAVGTLYYMAPEVMKGEPADARSDVYSLGVVLYELLTGTLPHRETLPPAIIYSVLNRKPPSPTSLRPDIPPGLERITLRALAKDPAQRIQSAAQLAQELRAVDLDSFVGETGEPANRPPMPTRRRARPVTSRTGSRRLGARSLPARKCLAIAAFRPIPAPETSGTSDQLLAAGLAESLSASIARVPHMRVVPPATMEQAIHAGQDASGVARALGANLLLTGTLSRSGDTVRVDYALLDTRHGYQLGGDRVGGSLSELLAFQDALQVSLIRALQVGSGLGAVPLPALRGAAAHEQYLRALGHLQRMHDEGAVDRAIVLLEELVIAEGDTALVHAALGRAYERKFRHARQPEWIQKAEASCRKALTLDPHAPEALITLGRVLNAAGCFEPAAEALGRALAMRDQDPDALRELSLAYEGLGRLDDAEEAARRLTVLWPDFWKGHDRLGMVRFRRARYEQAVGPWTRVVELTPDNANAHSNLGAAFFHLGWLEKAVEAFERCVEIRPTSESYIGLGAISFYLGRRRESAAFLEKAVTLQPRDARAWGNLADVQMWTPGLEGQATESFDRAIALVRAELRRNPNDADGWSQLGKWLAKRNRVAEALQAIEKALTLAPENVNCKVRGVTVYLRAGQQTRAAELLDAAVQAGYALAELEGDPELESLRRVPGIRSALEEARARRTPRDASNSNHGGR